MQFKKVGDRIQILAYVGYDKEKRRAKVQMLGSMGAYMPYIDDDLRLKLTPEQLDEVQAYIDQKKEKESFENDKLSLEYMSTSLNRHSRIIRDERFELSEDKANAIFEALDEVKKALKERGFKKPAKAKAQAENKAQQSLI